MNKTNLILFDIDGTLLSVDHQHMRTMIASLLESMNINTTDHQKVPFAGRTDRAIFSDLMGSQATDESLFGKVKSAYLSMLTDSLNPDWITIHNGVQESIEWCISNGIPYGLLTGNFEQAAYTKLSKAGLDRYFDFGAFGCDHTDRNVLPGVALQKARNRFDRPFQAREMIIIGDTPNDIACARYAGAVSIAVTTGPFPAAALREHKPNMLIESLENPGDWLDAATRL
jgi:phosphoglycolate phosphatase-like HAD superfamily hydrolase